MLVQVARVARLVGAEALVVEVVPELATVGAEARPGRRGSRLVAPLHVGEHVGRVARARGIALAAARATANEASAEDGGALGELVTTAQPSAGKRPARPQKPARARPATRRARAEPHEANGKTRVCELCHGTGAPGDLQPHGTQSGPARSTFWHVALTGHPPTPPSRTIGVAAASEPESSPPSTTGAAPESTRRVCERARGPANARIPVFWAVSGTGDRRARRRREGEGVRISGVAGPAAGAGNPPTTHERGAEPLAGRRVRVAVAGCPWSRHRPRRSGSPCTRHRSPWCA